MYKGIGHVAFTAVNMQESLDFYCNKLGFERAFSIFDDNGKPWIEYIKIGKGQFIELFYEENACHSNQSSCYSHLCIEVEDIYQIADFLTAKGIVLDVLPKQGKDANYQCWIRDPDGNRIEFMQMTEESPQSKASRK